MEPVEAQLQTLLGTLTGPGAAASAIHEVRLLLADGRIRGAAATTLAAAILLRSTAVDEVQLGHDLALAAMAAHRPARRLAAELFDRVRVLRGQPQKFGTQRGADGAVWPTDPATTDSERAKWDLPPRRVLADGAVDPKP